MRVEAFLTGHAPRWEEFAARCVNATLLHTRRFLGYHGDRLVDWSLLLFEPGGALAALLPAAEDPQDTQQIVSHPVATYGGLVHDGSLHGSSVLAALEAACHHFRSLGAKRLVYKPVPHIYHTSPAEDDLYALFRLGARRTRCGLSSSIDLSARREWAPRRRRGLRRARAAGLAVSTSSANLPAFWEVLQGVLQERHGVSPVHTLEEVRLLMSLFPREIELVTALHGAEVLAGTLLFHSHLVSHAQYIASSHGGKALGALDFVFEACIAAAQERGCRYFDFGISTERGGEYLNEGLETFKHEFGAGSTVYECYELEL